MSRTQLSGTNGRHACMSEAISSLKSDPKYFNPAEPTPLLPNAKEAKPSAVNLDAQPTSSTPVVMPKLDNPAIGGQCIDVAAWPNGLLESNAKALHSRLAKDPKSVTAAEKERLSTIEGELAKRYAKERPPTLQDVTPKKPKVEFCKRNVEIKMLEYTGLKHHWLRTSTKEAGMGPAGAGVPGKANGNNGSLLGPTTINDHTGEWEGVDAICEELPDVDEACVNEKLTLGKPTGRWTPGLNDCHTVTTNIIEDCKKPKEGPKGNTP